MRTDERIEHNDGIPLGYSQVHLEMEVRESPRVLVEECSEILSAPEGAVRRGPVAIRRIQVVDCCVILATKDLINQPQHERFVFRRHIITPPYQRPLPVTKCFNTTTV